MVTALRYRNFSNCAEWADQPACANQHLKPHRNMHDAVLTPILAVSHFTRCIDMICACSAAATRFHKKGLAATNQATRRQQHSTLDDMEAQLGLLQQQMEIERSVHASVNEFLASKAGQLQDDAGGWHSRREEDGRTKERALEVGRCCNCQECASRELWLHWPVLCIGLTAMAST